MQQNIKRGPWSEQCSKCKNYKSKRCTKLDINVNHKDWCKEWTKIKKEYRT